MNKTAIEWCDYTWNPVTGCLHGCPYCYARKIAERFKGSKAWPEGFKPMIHNNRSADPMKMKKPQTIFVCSMADLFGEWVPRMWIENVMTSCKYAPWHTYIFLTKNPERMARFVPQYPPGVKNNWWYGTSITGPEIDSRLETLKRMGGNRFVSFEPLLQNPGTPDLSGIKQVIIGAQTNPNIIPSFVAVENVVNAARKAGAKVFFKDSMKAHPHPLSARELAWPIHKEVVVK